MMLIPIPQLQSDQFWGIILFLIGLIYTVLPMLTKKRYPIFLMERIHISPQVLFDTFYKDTSLSEKDVIRLIKYVEYFLELPPGKLRPNDKFKDLSITKDQLFCDDLFYFYFSIEKICERGGISKDLVRRELTEKSDVTISDYIEFLAPLEGKIQFSELESEFINCHLPRKIGCSKQ